MTSNARVSPFSPPFDRSLLNGLSPAQFLKNYWQKKPLLIRQAIPNFQAVLTTEALFALAGNDEVEARLVIHQLHSKQNPWQLLQGPFERKPKAKKAWTLLVQGVNLYAPAADALMRRFNFIDYARLDDLMVSYAVDGGSVGPHFDNYDVFLLQAQGQRRWRISAQKDLDLAEGAPLKILRDFRPEQEFVLDPGDMLYLPPHIAHEGVAIGECMTYSIGFRAPTHQEIVREFLFDQAERILVPDRYADPRRKPTKKPAEMTPHMIKNLFEPIQSLRWRTADMTDFLGRYLTEPKAQVFFDRAPMNGKILTPARFLQRACKSGLKLHPKTQMLYRGHSLFINGTTVDEKNINRAWLKIFANQRGANASQCSIIREDAATLALLQDWHSAGWIEFRS